jgi:hypothetical protein
MPFSGKTTADISDIYPSLFVPAGITFAVVWSLIYLLLLVFIIYQARDLFKKEKSSLQLHEKTGFLFFLSSAANCLWLLAWQYNMILISLAVIIMLLILLTSIYFRLGTGVKPASLAEKLCVRLPFSVYLGWICMATIANATALTVYMGWGQFGLFGIYWTVSVLMSGALITLFMLYRRNDIFFGLVVLWAFAGIIIKRSADLSNESQTVIMAVSVCMAIIVFGISTHIRKWLKD